MYFFSKNQLFIVSLGYFQDILGIPLIIIANKIKLKWKKYIS